MKVEKTNNGKKGGLLKGKPHYDKDGNSLGGIKAVVTDAGNKPVELEGGEVIINKEASKKHWKLLSKINQSAGGGVPIGPPSGADFDEDPEEFKEGGRIIEFNPNHIPNKWVVQYAEKIKKDHPEIWKLGGNIFGNQAFENLLRVSKRGHWLDSEEWMYIKWRSYVARHKGDFRIEGVVAMLKWCDKVEKGWAYMKDLIEEKIDKIELKEEKASTKMATGGGLEKQNDTAKSLRERYRKLWRSLEENDLDVLLNYDYAFEEAGDVLGNLETLQEDYKNWLKNKGYSSKDSWKYEKTFLSHPIIAKKLKAAFSEKNKLINQEMKNIEKQLFSMYPVLAKVNKELDDYTGGPILAQKVYKSGKSWTIVVPNYDVRDIYLSLDEVNDLKKYIKESTSNVKMATGGKIMANLNSKLLNHFENNKKSFELSDIPKEILNKFPGYDKNGNIIYKSDIESNIYAGVKGNKKLENVISWTLDEETAEAFASKYEDGKLLELTPEEFRENFDFVSLDVVVDYIYKNNINSKETDKYFSESEIYAFPKNKMATGGGVENKKIKWKPSKNEKVEGFVSKSFPHSGKGDMLLTKAEFVKKWSPRIESWIGIKPNLSDVETFFPDYSMDFKFIGSDGNSYRIYSPGESSKSKQYVIQKFKANVQMAKGGEVDLFKNFKYKDGSQVKRGDFIELPYSKYGFHPEQESITKKYKVIKIDNSYRTPRLILTSDGDMKDLTINMVANYMPFSNKKMATGGGIDSIEPEGYKKEDAIRYGKKLVDANLKYREIRNKIEENYAGLRSEIQDVLNKVLDYYDKKPLKQNLSQEDKIAPGRIDELSDKLIKQLKRYAKENYNEDVIEDTFILKGEENNGDFQVKEVGIDTVSGKEIHITIEELFMKHGGELAKGIRAELEHKKTIGKIYNREVSKSKAAELIAKDHLKEDPKYYSKLEKIEGKKFNNGGLIINGENIEVGDTGFYSGRIKDKVIITKITNKLVFFTASDKKERNADVSNFTKYFTKSKSNEPTGLTTNGFKVGDIVEWAETVPNYRVKKGDKARVIGVYPNEEIDLEIEWLIPTEQVSGKYYSTNFIKPTQQKSLNSTIIENLEVYDEDLGLMTWDEATKKVKELGEGWRLPTLEEFENILYPNKSKIPNLKDSFYWSSEEFKKRKSAWTFNFGIKSPKGINYKSLNYYVLPVREANQQTQKSITTIKNKIEPGSLLSRIEKLEPTFIPSTDPSTWDAEFNVGDVVKIRVDLENKYPFTKVDGTPVKYEEGENSDTIIKVEVVEEAKRKENPSGKIYTVGFKGDWEGKDLELAYVVDKKESQQQLAQQQKQQLASKRQTKIEEPEPIKRKFIEGKDYLKIFTEYFEKDTQMGRPVNPESHIKAIVNNFIIATEDISGFNKDKIKEIKSFIDKE